MGLIELLSDDIAAVVNDEDISEECTVVPADGSHTFDLRGILRRPSLVQDVGGMEIDAKDWRFLSTSEKACWVRHNDLLRFDRGHYRVSALPKTSDAGLTTIPLVPR